MAGAGSVAGGARRQGERKQKGKWWVRPREEGRREGGKKDREEEVWKVRGERRMAVRREVVEGVGVVLDETAVADLV
jgi:hypothetical protein